MIAEAWSCVVWLCLRHVLAEQSAALSQDVASNQLRPLLTGCLDVSVKHIHKLFYGDSFAVGCCPAFSELLAMLNHVVHVITPCT